MYCSKCGKELTGKERFCPRCGNEVSIITENDIQQTVADNVSATKSKDETHEQKKRAGRTGKKSHRGRKILLAAACCLILVFIGVTAYYFVVKRMSGEQYLAAVQNEDGKWGYINEKGQEVIPCEYDLTGGMWIDGVAMAAKKSGINESGEETYKYGYINTKGEEVIPLQYDGASAYGTSILAVAEATGKDEYGNQVLNWGFMNTKGEMLTKSKYREIYSEDIPSFYINTYDMSYRSEQQKAKTGHHIVKDEIGENKEGVINEKGEEIIPLAVQDIVGEGEGLIAVGRVNGNGDMKYGYVNYQNEIVIPLEYDYACEFSDNGLALVEEDEKWGYIDTEGNLVIDFQFDSAETFEANGLAYVDEEKFINEKGEVVCRVPHEYDLNRIIHAYGGVFDSNGLATACKKVGGEYYAGLVNSKWEEVIKCRFDYIGQLAFKGYVAYKTKDDNQTKYQLINSNLDLLKDEYDMATGFGKNGWSAVGTKTGSLGDDLITYRCWYVDEEGKTVLKLPEKYINSTIFYSTD